MRCFQNIAKLIRNKRVTHPKNYSQSELSHLLGYKNGQFISNVERALCNIPLKMLRKVTEILDIPSEELKLAILKDQEATLNRYLYQTPVQNSRKTDGLAVPLNDVNKVPTKDHNIIDDTIDQDEDDDAEDDLYKKKVA
ncbi:MAG: helix-turn-helix transcriptional regulator [Oligoflexia bacterium]|nr:helix-turn-helix transcriptional regulator [Oligoflexia bacterium]